MVKEHCDCGKLAVWVYMPGYTSGESPYWCDDCVPRGCDCNHVYCKVDSYHPPLEHTQHPEGPEGIDWKWIEKDVAWVHLDEKQREYPCVEYGYDEEGWERDFNPHIDESITPIRSN